MVWRQAGSFTASTHLLLVTWRGSRVMSKGPLCDFLPCVPVTGGSGFGALPFHCMGGNRRQGGEMATQRACGRHQNNVWVYWLSRLKLSCSGSNWLFYHFGHPNRQPRWRWPWDTDAQSMQPEFKKSVRNRDFLQSWATRSSIPTQSMEKSSCWIANYRISPGWHRGACTSSQSELLRWTAVPLKTFQIQPLIWSSVIS